MHPLPPEHFTRRNLPHFTPDDAPYFVTFRLAGTISKLEAIRLKALLADKNLEASQTFFRTYDTLLDSARIGPKYLRQPEIMQQMHDTLRYASENWLHMDAYTIMPNHVHFVGRIIGEKELGEVMQSIKGYSARSINLKLNRTGTLWQAERYDRVVRDTRLGSTIWYILNNPCKAGLAKHWREWPGTYLDPDIEGFD